MLFNSIKVPAVVALMVKAQVSGKWKIDVWDPGSIPDWCHFVQIEFFFLAADKILHYILYILFSTFCRAYFSAKFSGKTLHFS